MTKFRWHRGGLDESMATVQEVGSFEELQAIIHAHHKEIWPHMDFTTEIKFSYCGPDPRIGWDTWYVLSRIPEADGNMEDWGVAGMTDGELTPTRYRSIKFHDYFGRGEERSDMGDVYIKTKKDQRKRKDEFYKALERCKLDNAVRPIVDATILCDADKFSECVNKQMVYPSGIDYFAAPHKYPDQTMEFIKARRYSEARDLPSHNLPMITADIYGQSDQRFRNCMTIGCGKAFKFQSEDDFTCPDCRQERAEMERRQGVEGDLLNANKVLK